MRKFLCFLLILFASCAEGQFDQIPKPLDTVSDYSEYISAAAKVKVKALADELYKVTSVNLKVLIVRQMGSLEVEAYGREVYEKWDVGQFKQGLDHGVLLLISIADRQVKIVSGRGVEHALPAKVRERIEWDIMALLSEGKFSEAVEVGVGKITQTILIEWTKGLKPKSRFDWHSISPLLFALFLFALLLTFVLGRDWLFAVSIVIGGLFGYLFLGIIGMVLGAALGIFLYWGRE